MELANPQLITGQHQEYVEIHAAICGGRFGPVGGNQSRAGVIFYLGGKRGAGFRNIFLTVEPAAPVWGSGLVLPYPIY